MEMNKRAAVSLPMQKISRVVGGLAKQHRTRRIVINMQII